MTEHITVEISLDGPEPPFAYEKNYHFKSTVQWHRADAIERGHTWPDIPKGSGAFLFHDRLFYVSTHPSFGLQYQELLCR